MGNKSGQQFYKGNWILIQSNIQGDGVYGHSEAHFRQSGQGRSPEEIRLS